MESALPFRFLSRYPPHAGDTRTELASALAGMKRKIVVLDDDPTGVQTVNGIYVYTAWDTGTMLEAFRLPEQICFPFHRICCIFSLLFLPHRRKEP